MEIMRLFFGNSVPDLHVAVVNFHTIHLLNGLYFGEAPKLRHTGLTTALAPLSTGDSQAIRTFD